MTTLANAESMLELKTMYRRLASTHHPDKGGCSSIMQKINNQYQIMQKRIKQASIKNSQQAINAKKAIIDDFSDVKPGTKLFVNGTACEVISVSSSTFHAAAISHKRQAVFCKKTGYGKYNLEIKASFTKQKPPIKH